MSHSVLSVGIVGLPNVGKSTLFNALRSAQGKLSGLALVANYPFATIEPNVGIVPVPDERLNRLAELVKNEDKMYSLPPIVPATVKFLDIAGLVKGASKGEGLGNQFLSHIREVDAIVQVVRVFEDENVIRAGAVDPKNDIEVVNTELILADLSVIQNRISKFSARGGLVSSKLPGDSGSLRSNQKVQSQVLEKLERGLNGGQLASAINLAGEEREAIGDLQLLTNKPFLFAFNLSEKQLVDEKLRSDLARLVGEDRALFICAQIEAELSSLSEAEQAEYLKQLGVKERGLDAVIRAGYRALGLISFLTAGAKEVRAWTTKKGAKASQAAGVIHTDFERGFIAAEVISTEDLLSAGSFKKARDLGKIRLEGREYVVQDGDVVEFRFWV